MSLVTAAQDSLATIAEESAWLRTGRYPEVERLCPAFAQKWPNAVRCIEFGRTPEGRPMLALVASTAGVLTPQDARAQGVPVLFIQGGIHSGEIDGKDAGFLALREMLADGALARITLVFVPVFNIDGHERFGRWNRPNQVGPEEMGRRSTAQNLNLNRDYTKADAPEMRAMLRLLGEWDPILYVDLHVTDGAQFQYDVANQVEPTIAGEPALQPMGAALLAETNSRISALGTLTLPFYPALRDDNDPLSGFALNSYAPRFSTGYWALRNRFVMLVETHSWKNYARRVHVTHDIIITLAELTARDGRDWLQAADGADERARHLGGTQVPLSFKITDRHRPFDFKGYAYRRQKSAVSGALAVHYDPATAEIWHVPLYDEVVPEVTVTAPAGGYLVPAAHAAWIAERLALHGIDYRTIETDLGMQDVESFTADRVTFGAQPFEGHMTATLAGDWKAQRAAAPKGSLFVPIAQPKARLVMALLEPRAPDSWVAWGFFNAYFEQKENLEDYVAEQVARERLARDPQAASEFAQRLATDPEFAKSPSARLEFFARRHPSWDERYNRYPLMRTARILA